MLGMFVDSDHKIWNTVLPFVAYVFNTITRQMTGYRPFFLLYVRPRQYALNSFLPFSSSDHICIAKTLCVAEKARRFTRLMSTAPQKHLKARYDDRH